MFEGKHLLKFFVIALYTALLCYPSIDIAIHARRFREGNLISLTFNFARNIFCDNNYIHHHLMNIPETRPENLITHGHSMLEVRMERAATEHTEHCHLNDGTLDLASWQSSIKFLIDIVLFKLVGRASGIPLI